MNNKAFKNIAIALNVFLILLFFGYFIGHGLPQSLLLWTSAILWLVATVINLFYILKTKVK